MNKDELTINCDGICKQRKKISELMILKLKENPKGLASKTFFTLYICKDCLSKARPLTIKDLEYY